MLDLHQSTGRYIMRIASGLSNCLDSFVEGSVMTRQEARVLQFIATAQTPICQRDIEAEYGCNAATISELIKSMEAKGLIIRETDPSDHRRKLLYTNPEIEPMVREMREKMIRMERELVEGIEQEKIDLFIELAKRMSRNIPPKGK